MSEFAEYKKMANFFTGHKVFMNGFAIGKQFQHGGFGELYIALFIETKKVCVAKMDIPKCVGKVYQLENEFEMYKLLGAFAPLTDAGAGVQVPIGIPKIYHYCRLKNGRNAMLMELLGLPLSKLFEKCNRSFSLKTVLSIAHQLIDRVEYIHSKGIVHRDIKMENFVIGPESSKNVIHLIDFGLSKKIQQIEQHEEIPHETVVGTEAFMSMNCLKGIAQCQRDDLESIFYVILLMLKGVLPWEEMQHRCVRDKHLRNLRRTNAAQEIPEDLQELTTFLTYVRKLNYAEVPNYSFLKKLINDICTRKQFADDGLFDWSSMNLEL